MEYGILDFILDDVDVQQLVQTTFNEIKLPVNYNTLSPAQRKQVRELYVKHQNGICFYCKEPLITKPTNKQVSYINTSLFPANFFKHPIHLHHDHITGATLGAVHCECNAILWQFCFI